MKMNIAYGVTGTEWKEYTSVSVYSILKVANPKDEYSFYILSDQFTNEEKDFFYKLNSKFSNATFSFIIPNLTIFKNATISNERGIGSFFRIFLPELLPDENKILYLDVDTVIHSDIAELYNYDISNYYLAGVVDKRGDYMGKFVPLKRGEYYINSGMLLMNLNKFREKDLSSQIFNDLKKTDFFCDQTSINKVCHGNILPLPIRFNVMINPKEFNELEDLYVNNYDEYLAAAAEPVIHHLWFKPWQHSNENLSIYRKWDELLKEIRRLKPIS